jgi:preprotein translocase subunit YajC
MSFALIAQAAQSGSSGILGFLPFILILVVVYFLMLRPQVKKQKQHTAMLNSLGRGDDVVTSGGIHGKIVGLNERDATLQVQIAKGIIVTVERGSVARKRTGDSLPVAETKAIESKPRRQDSESSNRETLNSGQPGSAMVVTGTRTGVDRPGGDSSAEAAKKNRYRRSRRRKPPYPAGQQGQSQTRTSGQEGPGSSGPAPSEGVKPEQPSGESQHVSE